MSDSYVATSTDDVSLAVSVTVAGDEGIDTVTMDGVDTPVVVMVSGDPASRQIDVNPDAVPSPVITTILEPGPKGEQGVPGVNGTDGTDGTDGVGIPGPPGDAGGFTFQQSVPALQWIIHHGLNRYPNVAVVDSSGRRWETAVTYVDRDNLIVGLNAQFSGTAYLI